MRENCDSCLVLNAWCASVGCGFPYQAPVTLFGIPFHVCGNVTLVAPDATYPDLQLLPDSDYWMARFDSPVVCFVRWAFARRAPVAGALFVRYDRRRAVYSSLPSGAVLLIVGMVCARLGRLPCSAVVVAFPALPPLLYNLMVQPRGGGRRHFRLRYYYWRTCWMILIPVAWRALFILRSAKNTFPVLPTAVLCAYVPFLAYR